MPNFDIPGVDRLTLFESKALIPIQIFAPGTYTKRMLSEGNSLLSSLFVISMDPATTVTASYWDSGVGSDAGERYELGGHSPLTAPTIPTDDRVLITKLHNKPNLEIIVSGGSAVLGVYITVVQSFASDLDSALKKDEQVFLDDRDKGIPVVTYDDSLNKFFFLRSESGTLPISLSEAGTSRHYSSSGTTTPGASQIIQTVTVGVGVSLKLNQIAVICRSHGTWKLQTGLTLLASGRTGPASPNTFFTFAPRLNLNSGSVLQLMYTAASGSPVADIESYIMGSEF